MFHGFVLSESLQNPAILNKFKKIYVRIEEHPESKIHFWHLFKVEVDDKEIEKTAAIFSKETKHGWFAHFWNSKIVYICFRNKIFKILQETEWSSKEFQKVKEYGIKNGIEERYLLNLPVDD